MNIRYLLAVGLLAGGTAQTAPLPNLVLACPDESAIGQPFEDCSSYAYRVPTNLLIVPTGTWSALIWARAADLAPTDMIVVCTVPVEPGTYSSCRDASGMRRVALVPKSTIIHEPPSGGIRACTKISEPGFYQLQNNIEARDSSTCLEITVADVVLDLGGFVIRGSGWGTAIGGGAIRRLTIRNGTITGEFLESVSLPEAAQVKLSEITVASYGNGPVLGDEATVRDSIFRPSSPRAGDAGLTVGRRSVVRDSMITDTKNGLMVGASSLVLHNIVRHNVLASFTVGDGSLVMRNIVVENTDGGMRIEGRSMIVNNNAFDNALDIAVSCPSNLVGNSGRSIRLEQPQPGSVGQTECTLSDNLFLTVDP